MREFLIYTVVVALLAAFVLLLLYKWRAIEWLQVHGDDVLEKVLNKTKLYRRIRVPRDIFERLSRCNYCLSFWTGLFFSIPCVFIAGNPWLLLVPFCSTVITRKLL